MRTLHYPRALPILFALGLVGCEATKSENPLSPAVAGPLAGVDITAPRLLEPTQGFKVKESQQPLKLLIENSTTSGVRPITYVFEISTDEGFQAKVYARSGITPGDGGRTSVTVDRLDLGRAYYWRVRAEDGANASGYSTASFEVLPKPLLNPPGQIAPVNGETTSSRRPVLSIGSPERNSAIGVVHFNIQVSTDAAFTAIVASGIREESGRATEFVPDGDLAANTVHFWRVSASDGETTSAWSGTQTFRTPAAPAPAPGPGPGPLPAPGGGPCNSSSPQAIAQCERAKFGAMSEGDTIQFLINLADSLNRNNIPGGRFGLLRKDGGHQCLGYSCDIICSGNGGAQRQWDVLVDSGPSASATWSEVPQIANRPCEIR